MYIEINSKKTRISEAFAIAAMILLLIDTANTFLVDWPDNGLG
jgi:hypothetical protein